MFGLTCCAPNQPDIDECSEQVLRIRDIPSKARQVLVGLGRPPDTKAAFDIDKTMATTSTSQDYERCVRNLGGSNPSQN